MNTHGGHSSHVLPWALALDPTPSNTRWARASIDVDYLLEANGPQDRRCINSCWHHGVWLTPVTSADWGAYPMASATFWGGDPSLVSSLISGQESLPSRVRRCRGALHRPRCVPDGLGHPGALPLAVVRQAPDEVDEVQAAAKDAAHGAEQHQLAVVGRGRAQRALQLLHHLQGTRGRLLTAPAARLTGSGFAA